MVTLERGSLWSRWIDSAAGEWVDNYTPLTMNANVHPLMNRIHKTQVDPKTKLPLPAEMNSPHTMKCATYKELPTEFR